jgi:S1-C subfamily serine protease
MQNTRRIFYLLLACTLVANVARADDGIMPYRAVCQVHTVNCSGTGTLIAKRDDGTGLVLSCRHVCQDVDSRVMCIFHWANGKHVTYGRVVAVVKGKNYDTDLALIVIDQSPAGIAPRPVSRFKLADGPWIGAGFRAGFMFVTPVITHCEELQGGQIMFPSQLVKGQSGGALFNRRGEIVAVLVASDFATRGVACDGENLHRLVNQYLSK